MNIGFDIEDSYKMQLPIGLRVQIIPVFDFEWVQSQC